MVNSATLERRTVHYSGHVQGVGFRYSVLGIAQKYAVRGYVQNLANGQVELVAEGETAELTTFLQNVSQVMRGYILSAESLSQPAAGEFSIFEIRH